MPVREDLELIETAPEDMKAQAYDLVLNGYELGGGSIRIFEKDIQEKMFALLGFTKKKQQNSLDSFLRHLNTALLRTAESRLA